MKYGIERRGGGEIVRKGGTDGLTEEGEGGAKRVRGGVEGLTEEGLRKG